MATLDLGHGVRAICEHGLIRFAASSEADAAPEPVSLRIPGSCRFGRWEVRAEVCPAPVEPAGPDLATLDADALGEELLVRRWRDGDRMRPLGMDGTKTLQDLFTDRGVPRSLRHHLPVVTAAGQVVWVAGVAVSEDFRLGPAGPRGRSPDGPRPRLMNDSAIGEVLVADEDLQRRVAELGAEISRDYAGRDLVMIGVLKGALLFIADLMRQLTVPCEVDFMAVSSYGSSTDSSGVVRILKDLDAPIEGRDVLIVEDIIDSGLTLQYLLRNLRARSPGSLEVCALLTKPARRRVELPIRYVGFEIPNRYVIGYGLDYAQRYRNLSFVAVLNEQPQ